MANIIKNKCLSCGKENKEDTKFCASCGKEIYQKNKTSVGIELSDWLIAIPPGALLLGLLKDPALFGNEGILIGAIAIVALAQLIGFLRKKISWLKTLAIIWIVSIILCGFIIMIARSLTNETKTLIDDFEKETEKIIIEDSIEPIGREGFISLIEESLTEDQPEPFQEVNIHIRIKLLSECEKLYDKADQKFIEMLSGPNVEENFRVLRDDFCGTVIDTNFDLSNKWQCKGGGVYIYERDKFIEQCIAEKEKFLY